MNQGQWKEEDERAAKRAGCAPGEVKTGVEHFVYSEHGSDEAVRQTFMAWRSPVVHIRRTQAKHNAVPMSNQLLPTQWGRLTLRELALFHSSVSDLVRVQSKLR